MGTNAPIIAMMKTTRHTTPVFPLGAFKFSPVYELDDTALDAASD